MLPPRGKERNIFKNKIKVLFLCSGNSIRSAIAEGLLKKLAPDRVESYSAGLEVQPMPPALIEIMREIEVDLRGVTTHTLADLGTLSFDVVITLCDQAREFCLEPSLSADEGTGTEALGSKRPLFVGDPVHLHWSIEGAGEPNSPEQLRRIRDDIHQHLRNLLDHGYLEAIARQRRHLEQILDGMQDGIIVHDSRRHIFLFNRAAEQITGYQRSEVLGAGCHTIFSPDGLCGSSCPVTGGTLVSFPGHQCEVGFTTKQGEDRRLKVVSTPMVLQEGCPPSVLAIIRDVTEVSELRQVVKNKYSFHGMVGVSPPMRDIFETIRQVTSSEYPVLITGESGTGKELVARAIHNESRRRAGPFVPINCGALPENILESELFGHVRGAFTGAIRDKKGRFELAHKGTLFLDEVGELSPAFQVKLLRVLQEKSFEPVGGEKTITVEVRVIGATNRDLKKMVAEKSFRDDLFYRLSVVPIHLPPLRSRKEDFPLLVEQILAAVREETGKDIRTITDEVMDLLLAYPWPGNIRELINVLQFASVRTPEGQISASHLPPELRRAGAGGPHPLVAPTPGGPVKIRHGRNRLTQAGVEHALEEALGNRVLAAKLLGVGRATLYRFLNKHSVS